MKLVLFADLHLDSPFRWARPEVARRRRQALRDVLGAIVDLAAEVEADAVCCAGDLYEHDRVAPDTAAVIQRAFANLAPIPVLVAPGNHDWLGPQSLYARTAWSPNVHIFTEERLQRYELTSGLAVWGAAHKRPAGTAGFLDDFQVDGAEDVHLALFHGTLRSGLPFEEEGKQVHAPFDEEQIAAAGLRHALVGHFHTPSEGRWHTYPGNPDPLTFGETGERGAVVLEIQEGSGAISRTRHRLAKTDVSDVTVDVTGCSSRQEVRNKTATALESLTGVVRVTLAGEVDPSVNVKLADLDDVAPHLEALVARLGRITVAYDLDSIARETTVRGRFVQDVRAAALEPDMERRVLLTGLRALEGRNDLEVV